MESTNRYTRSKQMDNRKDLIVWERIYNNILTLASLRRENDAYLFSLRECQAKLEETINPEAKLKQEKRMVSLVKDGKLSAKRIREKVMELKDDAEIMMNMQSRKDYSVIPELPKKQEEHSKSSTPVSNQKRTLKYKEGEVNHRFSNKHIKTEPPLTHIPIGSRVVAKMLESADPNQEWILAYVIHYYPEKDRYQVEDEEVDEEGQKSKYILDSKYVIRLDCQDLTKEFPVNHVVLALYPSTTCFYKATVIAPPSQNRSKGHHLNSYMVKFEDDNDNVRWVKMENVLDMPDVQEG